MPRNGALGSKIVQGEEPLLPSYFIIGPPRTGTSWLHEVLSEHTLLPFPTKETRFFDMHFHRGLSWYAAHFPSSDPVRTRGEIAPTYFASAEARERLARVIPKARIVCIFRDPVQRVFSLYRLKRAYGMIPWSFEQAMLLDPELLESSRYAANLRSWQHDFGPQQVMAALYDDLRDDPQSFVDSIAEFIGIPRFTLTAQQLNRVHSSETMTHPRNYYRTRGATWLADWCKARRLDGIVTSVKRSSLIKLFLGGGPAFAELSRDVSQSLYELFRPDVEELEAILKRDLSAWKSGQKCLRPASAVG